MRYSTFVSALYLDNRTRQIAHELADTKLMAKLSEGDMVATKAKYHRKCLVYFYHATATIISENRGKP